MADSSKRLFLRSILRDTLQGAIAAFQEGKNDVRRREDFDRFFSSYENSHTLTLCYPDDILLETARREGIQIEGRDKLEIVKELFEKKGGI